LKKPIEKSSLLHLSHRRQWRAWLKRNYKSAKEVWLVYAKKHTGKPRLAYNDAVEEALCFGWIDSTVRTLDKDRFAQRFSPRKPGSRYSQANLERVRSLVRRGKVAPQVLTSLGTTAVRSRFRVPPDIRKAIQDDSDAWKHFRKFSPAYKRIRIAFIDGARDRPREFQKRLRYFIRMTAKNRKFGFGGIEKYY
jgi:uncharacterized protein YdeI (YjbR/CyaY-like superfamily)